jgi:anti-anti-sigma factor
VAVDVRTADGTATVVISGELDICSTPCLAAQLSQALEGGPERLVFDMTQVGFIDVAAARLIASTAGALPAGRRPVLLGAGPLVRRVLVLTGLDGQLDMPAGPTA